jgi:hypothetical protein
MKILSRHTDLLYDSKLIADKGDTVIGIPDDGQSPKTQ